MKDKGVMVYESVTGGKFDIDFDWRDDIWVIYSRFLTPHDVPKRIENRPAHNETEKLWDKFWRGLQYLGFERNDQDTTVPLHLTTFFSLRALMARVAKVRGLNVLLGEPADVYDGIVATDPGKAAVLNYEFARRQAKVFYLSEVLEVHLPWMSPDQLKRKCIKNCPTFEDIQWFEANFRQDKRRRKSPNSTGRPKAKNDAHVALMKELYEGMSLLEVAKELLARGITAPNGKPYSPQNVDYYLHRRNKKK